LFCPKRSGLKWTERIGEILWEINSHGTIVNSA
jgi:hypothetical protein